MAFSLHSNLNFLALPKPNPTPTAAATTTSTTTTKWSYTPIICGKRSNRGQLQKGRILSTEAIHAIQSLKRAQRSDLAALNEHLSKTLSRLLKADLIAAFKELIRQDNIELALRVFSAVRSEYDTPGLNLYADLVNGLSRNGLTDEIDSLVSDMVENEGSIQCDDKGLIEFVKALIAAERRESTVKIYGLMKKSGWDSSSGNQRSRFEADEYVGKVLSNGLRRMGEESLADEIDKELNRIV